MSGRPARAGAHAGERDFRTLAENLPDGVARLDARLRFRFVNRAAVEALGIEAGALAGRRGGQAGLPAHIVAPLEQAAARALESGAEQRFSFDAGPAGAGRHIGGRVIPEPGPDGSVEALLAIFYDETARARDDERRAGQLAREASARADAESANHARDQFLALVSHELRSPLNGIKSWTHVLENILRDPDPAVRRALDGILVGVARQVQLIDELLDVTRAMAGNLALFRQPMALLPVLADAVESIRAAAAEKEVRIATDYRLAEHEIHGDPERVRQIFAHLLANAVSFTPPGGSIRVAAGADDAMARIEVRDDGAGIPAELLAHVFDPFRQADQDARGRGLAGLGLGLALVQRLAQLHGGYATCESEGSGHGATFRVYLPLRRDAGARAAVTGGTRHDARTGDELPALAGVRVLVIDDQREARESLGTLLAQAGADVTLAGSGHEALAHLALDGDGSRPEVIVCDIAMPDEDGYATLRRVRAWEAKKPGRGTRPALAVSAFTQREDRLRALGAGFQMHLAKPVAPAELVAAIASIAHGMRA